MKLGKQTLKRLVSILVVIAIMATNFVSLLATSVSAETITDEGAVETVQYGTQKVDPVKLLPYYMGDNATQFPGTNIDIRGSFNGVSGRVTGDTLADLAPQISEKGEGYNGTYAMKYGTDKGGFTRYLTTYRLEGAMSKLVAEPITVEMKVKLVSGDVKALYAGNYRSSAPTGFSSENYYTTENLSTTEWTTLKFTRTESAGTSRWMFINLVSDGKQGAVILIDDIKIYLESDEFKTNYFTSDNIWSNKVTQDCQSGNYYVGTFDIDRGLVFDNTPVANTTYDADNVGARSATVAPVISAAGEGVKKSYAMQLGVNEATFKNDVSFQAKSRQTINSGNTYTVEFKVKVKSGSVDYLKAGIFEKAYGDIPSQSIYPYCVKGYELSRNWQYYKFDVAPTSEDIKNWKTISLYLVGTSADTVILIDDLIVYKSDDETKTLLEYQNHATGGVIATDGSFDIPVSTLPKHAPVAQIGYYLGSGTVDPGNDFQARNAGGSNYTLEKRATMMPRISEEGEGYNSPYAMKVGHTEPLSRYRFNFRFSDDERGAFVKGTSYTIEMKVKKVSGTLDTFAAGQYYNTPTDYLSEGYYTDTDISTEEYTTLTFTRKAFNPAKDPSDSAYYTGVRYVFFDITALGEDGVILLIDNIYIYATDDETKTNLFTGEKLQVSTTTGFEPYYGGAINVGEFECPGTYNITDNTPEEGVLYSYPHRIANNDLGEVGNAISGSNTSVIASGNEPKFTQKGEGVKGSYAMEIGGTTAIAEGEHIVSFATRSLTPSTKLRLEADVRLVSGSVLSLKMGIAEARTTENTLNNILPNLITDKWTTFTWTQTTNAYADATWVAFKISLSAPDGGAILHIDNIKIYAEGDETKTPLFHRFTDFDLDFDIASFTPIEKDSSESIFTPSFNHSGETFGNDSNGNVTTGGAQLVCMENAHSGDYALAIGYDDEQLLTNYGVRFGLRELLPGKRYRVTFATAISGGSFYKMSASLTSAIGNADEAEVIVYGHQADNHKDSVLKTKPYEWTEVTFDFYEGGTMYDRGSWAYLKFNFDDYNIGIGDSALFIDSVTIEEIDEDGNVIGPNIFGDGGFEYIANTFDWEKYDSPFWSEGGADDFAFMNSIDKEIGAYNATVEAGLDLFDNMLNKEPYSNFDTYIIGTHKLDVLKYEAEKLTDANKKVWLGLTSIIRQGNDEGERWLVENWQDLIMGYANELQVICGDNFQGFYFDEPGYYLTNEQYIEVTKWLRETFKKRVWSVHYKGTVNSNTETSKLTITKESHQYTTDVGYWRYGNWEEDAAATFDIFKGMCEGENPLINVDTRKWMVPILGRHAYYDQTAEDVLGVIQNMYNGFSEINGFGGVAFYSMAYDKNTATVAVDENGNDPVLEAINNGVLKCVDIKNPVVNEDGTKTYTFLQYGGYYMLDKTDKDYLPAFDVVCDEVDAIINDFAIHNALTVGANIEIDGNLVIHDAGNTVADLIDSLGLNETIKVLANDVQLSDSDIVKNGQTLSIADLRGKELTYTIVKKNDLNSDGYVNAVDVVRGKKAAAGSVEISELENLAATASRAELTITDIAALRNDFMN